MPPPLGPYDRANPPGSSGLTQSHDDARQQANRAQGYEPDALQRTLDWIGRQLGSGRSARSPGPSAGSRVVDWIGRQFESDPWATGGSKNPRVTDPYDRKNPAVDAWFRSLENSPTPFGNVQYGPKKPVTKISSAPKIQKKLATVMAPQYNANQNMGNTEPWMPPMPESPHNEATGVPLQTYPESIPNPYVHDEAGGSPLQYSPVDMRTPPPRPGPGPRPPDVNIFSQNPPQDPSALESYLAWRNGLVSSVGKAIASPFQAGWSPGVPDIIQQYMPQTRGPNYGKAEGGPVGLMRGGYPDLFGAQRMPVRHTFDSGGESFVGSEYSDGSGRADDVNAKLSAKEYVIDAETMALLGDGNPDHGAEKMDQMRANIRKQKGKAFSKGKFSPKAKSAQEYLVGNPAGDGLRRRGKDKG